jgi:putative tricarboxylic transport membrane protein
MKHPDLISGFFWLAIGLLLSIWSGVSYEVGSFTQPGPGFVPFVLGLLLILLASILLGQTRRSSLPSQRPSSSCSSKGWKKAAYVLLIYVIGIFLFEVIGYLFTFFLMILFLMHEIGSRTWKVSFLTALLSTLGVYLVFVSLLELQLPRSPLGI